MLEVDQRAELAPRDIVARAIAAQIESNGLGFVHLDVSHLPADFLRAHFPQIYQTLLALGIDITTDPIPVAPTAHYSCGGIVTCSRGLTDVQGLYAAGEVAYTGLHGANRLASNSLLECVSVGRNIAEHLPSYLLGNQWQAPIVKEAKLITLPFDKSVTPHSNTDINGRLATDIAIISAKLKALMSSHLGITRHGTQLEQALQQIQQWQQDLTTISNDKSKQSYCQAQETLTAIDSSATLNNLSYLQLTRQLQLATLIVLSAYQRCESRGGHYRQDFPNLADESLVSVINPMQADKFIDKRPTYQLNKTTKDHLKVAAVV